MQAGRGAFGQCRGWGLRQRAEPGSAGWRLPKHSPWIRHKAWGSRHSISLQKPPQGPPGIGGAGKEGRSAAVSELESFVLSAGDIAALCQASGSGAGLCLLLKPLAKLPGYILLSGPAPWCKSGVIWCRQHYPSRICHLDFSPPPPPRPGGFVCQWEGAETYN